MRRDDGSFCFQLLAGDRVPRGRSLRYTLIVLLGLLRAESVGLRPPIASGELLELVRSELDSPELTPGDLGLWLWAQARSGEGPVAGTGERAESLLGRIGGVGRLDGLELSWLLIGLSEAAAARGRRVEPLLAAMAAEHLRRCRTPSGLALHRGSGWRARFPNFATQIYGVLALSRFGRLRKAPEAIGAARMIADRLLALQRPNGGWPWIFDARRGAVVEPYEIYTVHQDAMAPMALLELSKATGERDYRDAALVGLEWVAGANELGTPMLDRSQGMVYRSIRRRAPFNRLLLYANTATASAGRPLLGDVRGPLEVNRSDRPYHLGWVLEAWSASVA